MHTAVRSQGCRPSQPVRLEREGASPIESEGSHARIESVWVRRALVPMQPLLLAQRTMVRQAHHERGQKPSEAMGAQRLETAVHRPAAGKSAGADSRFPCQSAWGGLRGVPALERRFLTAAASRRAEGAWPGLDTGL